MARSGWFRRTSVVGILAVVVAMVAAGCAGGSSGGGGQSGGDIKIGATYELTGLCALLGKQASDGARAYAQYVNDNGGVLGRKIALDLVDNQSQPTLAVRQATQFVQSGGAVAVVGPVCSNTSPPVVQAANNLKKPIITNGGNWPYTFTDPSQYQWAWTATPIVAKNGMSLYPPYLQSKSIKKVAVVGPEYPLLTQTVALYKSMGASLPFQITGVFTFPSGSKNVTPQVLKAVATKPDLLLTMGAAADAVAILKAVSNQGINVPIGLPGGDTTPAFMDAVGKDVFTKLSPFGFTYQTQVFDQLPSSNPLKAEIGTYMQAMQKIGASTDGGTSNAAMGWDAMKSIVTAIKDAGSTDPEALQKALQNQRFVGVTAEWNRTPTDHEGASNSYVLVQLVDGAWKLVYTPGNS